ncbi:uncharacterized protein B0I36DRAFT_348626 [Microdochium trichocladiopsis]|uniref:BTB domain-containing protein n=1 Tax=Microdochium trichocladiopsis TaxID=1682393 RepID=A0A9P8Y9D9_9PEZI|nr:uncharacterized protein B0I36DRAFT_348626 [Microdochium trichocladiopsis]KAH7033589.1 hypothetical protein B0I36DRAFT_348626 [Microdochium trichocladiopsis]
MMDAADEVVEQVDTKDPPPATSAVEDIVPTGDVILVVGSGEDMVKLRAHSVCLKLASDGFEGMFDSSVPEGQVESCESPREVAFPADTPNAMRIICQILHHQYSSEDRGPLSADDLLSVALHADRYTISWILVPYMKAWLSTCATPTTTCRLKCLAAASDLKSKDIWPWVFDIVARCTGSYSRYLQCDTLRAAFSTEDIYRLEEMRTELRMSLLDLINKQFDAKCECRASVPAKQRSAQLRKQYTAAKVLQVPAIKVIEKLMAVYVSSAEVGAYKYRKKPSPGTCRCGCDLLSSLDQLYERICDKLLGKEEK